MLKKVAIFYIIILSFSTYSKAQSMTSRTLLNNLEPFWGFLESLRKNTQESTGKKYTSHLEQSYSFIQLELRDTEQLLLLQVRYQLQHPPKLDIYSFYCDDKKLSKKLKTQCRKMVGDFEWNNTPSTTFILSEQQSQYFEIADRIASLANDINATPTCYGAVIITSESIKLEQINRWNSKSLDHKDSYFMRDLYFVIPLIKNDTKEKTHHSFGSYYIGTMEVFFQDGSAKKQRTIGDKIMMQLEKEIENYN